MASPAQHLRPADLHTQLGAWVSAGLITDEQAGQILEFEGGTAAQPAVAEPTVPVRDGRGAGPSAPAVGPAGVPAVGRTVLAVEVVAYLGAALIVAAVMGILGPTWED
ncbi:MAG: hypothetical protein ACKO04_07230, partial [Actinomycetes bacterium]